MRVRRRVVVSGRVQGVFFRETCRQMARAAGVGGWVTNRPDGGVEACFEGEEDAVARLIEWCGHGPDMAAVSSVEVHDEDPRGETRFVVR